MSRHLSNSQSLKLFELSTLLGIESSLEPNHFSLGGGDIYSPIGKVGVLVSLLLNMYAIVVRKTSVRVVPKSNTVMLTC